MDAQCWLHHVHFGQKSRPKPWRPGAHWLSDLTVDAMPKKWGRGVPARWCASTTRSTTATGLTTLGKTSSRGSPFESGGGICSSPTEETTWEPTGDSESKPKLTFFWRHLPGLSKFRATENDSYLVVFCSAFCVC